MAAMAAPPGLRLAPRLQLEVLLAQFVHQWVVLLLGWQSAAMHGLVGALVLHDLLAQVRVPGLRSQGGVGAVSKSEDGRRFERGSLPRPAL